MKQFSVTPYILTFPRNHKKSSERNIERPSFRSQWRNKWNLFWIMTKSLRYTRCILIPFAWMYNIFLFPFPISVRILGFGWKGSYPDYTFCVWIHMFVYVPCYIFFNLSIFHIFSDFDFMKSLKGMYKIFIFLIKIKNNIIFTKYNKCFWAYLYIKLILVYGKTTVYLIVLK